MFDEAVHEDDGTLDFCRSLKTSIELRVLRNCDPFVCVWGGAGHGEWTWSGRSCEDTCSCWQFLYSPRAREIHCVHLQSRFWQIRDAASFPPSTPLTGMNTLPIVNYVKSEYIETVSSETISSTFLMSDTRIRATKSQGERRSLVLRISFWEERRSLQTLPSFEGI
jgi:hypothetical protein